MADPISVTQLVNEALDKVYQQTAGPLLKQVEALTNSPSSPLQQALRKLDEEAQRLEEAGERMPEDNAVLQQTLAVVQQTYILVGSLIQSQAPKVQSGGVQLAIPAVTAKVFMPITQFLLGQQVNPVSPQALNMYLAKFQQNNIHWRTR
jgi:hypothetical protein